MNRLEEIVEAAVTQWGLATYDGTDASIWIARAVRDEAARAVCWMCRGEYLDGSPAIGPTLKDGVWVHAVAACPAGPIYAALGTPEEAKP